MASLETNAAPKGRAEATEPPLRLVIVGHVDHGKSTLVGRLLADAGALPDGKLEQIRVTCERRGVPFEWAFVMDALQAERDQNITIDASQIWLRQGPRPVVIIDAPGHREFLKNMVTGAAAADAALLVVAADEGVREQSRRHGYLLSLLGVTQVVVAVNKMDLVGRDEGAFRRIEAEMTAFLESIGVRPLRFVPIAARAGDNIASRSAEMPWYDGPPVLDVITGFERPRRSPELPLRFFVQDVYRFDHRRILAGRIEAGTLKVGDTVRFSPGDKVSTVASLEVWSAPARDTAVAGESVGITLSEQIFVERGHVASHQHDAPTTSRRVRARLFWMGKRPLEVGRAVKLRLCTSEQEARVVSLERVIDASTLEEADRAHIQKDDVAEVILETRGPLAFDRGEDIQSTGRFVIVDGYDVAGGGVVLEDAGAAEVRTGPVTLEERAQLNGHRGAVLALDAGDEGREHDLERALFERGLQVAVARSEVAARALAAAGLVALVPAGSAFDGAQPLGSVAHASLSAIVDEALALVRPKGRAAKESADVH